MKRALAYAMALLVLPLPATGGGEVISLPGDAKQWQAVVAKMIKVFGAQLSEQEARTIVDYLALAYGFRSDARGSKDK